MQIDKVVRTHYTIRLSRSELEEAVLAYIRDNEDIDMSEAEDLSVTLGGYSDACVVEGQTEETE